MLSSLLLLGLTAASPLIKRSFPNPEACSGLCDGDVHDPSVVLRGDGTYFRFTTNDLINIATSPSINGPWTHQGSMIQGQSVIDLPGNNDLWAPDVFLYDGTYYGFYAVSTSGSQNSDIGVATSTTMEPGSWTDHGSVGIPNNNEYNKIDPNLFQMSPNSPLYLSWGSYWTGIYQTTFNSPPTTMSGGASITNVAQNTTAPDYIEGSYQFWWTVDGTDYNYLFFSSGYCCNTPPNLPAPGDEYKIMVCRSQSATGPFVDQNGNDCTSSGGTLVLGSHDDVYAPGGQGVMFDPNVNSPIVYYHYVQPSVGYNYDQFYFGWNKLDFSSGWPVVTS